MQNQTVFKHMSAVRSAAPETGLKSFFAMIRSSTLKKTRKRKGCHTEGIGQDMSRQNQPEIFGCFLPNNNKLELQKSTLVEKAVLWWRNKHLGLIEKWTDRYLENSGVFFFFDKYFIVLSSHLYLGNFFSLKSSMTYSTFQLSFPTLVFLSLQGRVKMTQLPPQALYCPFLWLSEITRSPFPSLSDSRSSPRASWLSSCWL